MRYTPLPSGDAGSHFLDERRARGLDGDAGKHGPGSVFGRACDHRLGERGGGKSQERRDCNEESDCAHGHLIGGGSQNQESPVLTFRYSSPRGRFSIRSPDNTITIRAGVGNDGQQRRDRRPGLRSARCSADEEADGHVERTDFEVADHPRSLDPCLGRFGARDRRLRSSPPAGRDARRARSRSAGLCGPR
jgi:hypothetical protein